MIKHIFKISLKKKKLDLLFESLGTYFILFIICAFVLSFKSSLLQPKGFNHEDIMVLAVYPSNISDDMKNKEEFTSLIPGIKAFLAGHKKIHTYCEAPRRNQPYIFETAYWPVEYKGTRYTSSDIHVSYADDNYADVVDLNVIEGRWFNTEDNVSNCRPAVINELMAKQIFSTANPVGEIFECGYEDEKQCCKVVGIIKNYRPGGELGKEKPIYILRNTKSEVLHYDNLENCSSNSFNIGEDYGGNYDGNIFFINVNKKDQITLESHIYNILTGKYDNIGIKIRRLSEFRKQYKNRKLIPIVVLFIILVFLVINTLAGFMGVLWYNIKARQNEIALRMAVGANKKSIYKQFIGEMLVLATLGIIPGLIIAIQFPVLKIFNIETHVYLLAMLIASVIIYLLITLCALLPSVQAAKTQPALALHEQ